MNILNEYGSRILYNAYNHPRSNPTELVNIVIRTMISSHMKDNHRHWEKEFNKLESAIRTACHEVTVKTPYFLSYGKEMVLNGKKYRLNL